MTLTLEQIALLGIIATLLVQGTKMLIVALKDKAPTKEVMTKIMYIVTFVISTALAFVWLRPTIVIENLTDPVYIVQIVLEAALAVFGLAKIIYEYLLRAILDKIGWNADDLIALKASKPAA